MGYYGQMRGDYYRGDYYRGDPFLGFLGRLIGGVTGLGGLFSKGGSAMKPISTAIEKVGPIVTKLGKHKGALMGGAGAVAGIEAFKHRKKLEHMVGMGGKHRRMRVTNVKALRRAIRRTHGFAKLAMRTIHLVHPKKAVRFGGFKRRTKKR